MTGKLTALQEVIIENTKTQDAWTDMCAAPSKKAQ